jgi:Xaa-Pro aminopeptidase
VNLDRRHARLAAIRRLGNGWTLLTDRADVRWASGFGGSAGWLLVGPDSCHLVTDARYSERARDEVPVDLVDVVTTDARNERHQIVARVVDESPSTTGALGIRSTAITLAESQSLTKMGLELQTVDVASLRRVKDDDEISAVARAAHIADRALHDVITMIDVGVTELDVRDELEYRMRRLGADGPSYDTIVAAGPRHSAIPHHRPTSYAFAAGDPVVIDVGALVDGYHSDMTRTFVVGEPSNEFRRWYAMLAEAQLVALKSVRAGVECRTVDAAARAALGDEAQWFVHGTGHGVGLDIHEEPFLNGSSSARFVSGEVVTVEPGLYRVGLGGVRIEDLVVVGSNGADVLTSFPKDLLCLPSPPTT